MGTLHCDDIFLVNNNCMKTPPKDDVSATNWEGQKADVDQTVSRVDHIFLCDVFFISSQTVFLNQEMNVSYLGKYFMVSWEDTFV